LRWLRRQSDARRVLAVLGKPPERFGKTVAVSGGGKTVGWRSKSTDRRREESSTTRSRPVFVGPSVLPLEKLRAMRAVPARAAPRRDPGVRC
jgi:hypothetical protein